MRRPRLAATLLAAAVLLGDGAWFGFRYVHFRHELSQSQQAVSDGRTRAALDHLAECDRFAPFDRTVMLLSIRLLRMTEAWTEADSLLVEYAKQHGNDDDFVAERLMLKAASEDTNSVIAALQQRIARRDESARFCRHALVSGLLREFRFQDALTILAEWQAEDPNDTLALLLTGWMNEMRYNTLGAREAYSALVAQCPDHHEGRLRLVNVLVQLLVVDEALAHLAVLRTARPDDPAVATQWAIVLRLAGRTDEARVALNNALGRFPNAATALAERGSVAMNNGDDQSAAEDFSKALLVDPGAVPVRQLLVQALARLGRSEEAANEQARADALRADSNRMSDLLNGPLQTRPNDPGPPAELAAIALRSGQPNTAIKWYQLALKRDPRHAPSHTALAVIYRELGNPLLATRHRALAAPSGGGP